MSNRHKHVECKHEHMKYCSHCRIAFCDDCGKEWREHSYTTIPQWYYGTGTAKDGTFPNSVTLHDNPNSVPVHNNSSSYCGHEHTEQK